MALVLFSALFVFAYSQALPAFWAQSFMNPVVDGIEYRSLNGTGNNVQFPMWGSRYVPLTRMQMPAEYYNGPVDPAKPSGPFATGFGEIDRVYSCVRCSSLSATLPNIRSVSNRIQEAQGGHEHNLILLNQMHVDWGHMVTIDTMNTAVDRGSSTVKVSLGKCQ